MHLRPSFLMLSACIACSLAAGSLQAQALAKLAHRFTFEGNAVDVVGGMPGIRVTGNEGYHEPPDFEPEVPPGATGPAQSMRVGMHYGQKKSGIILPSELLEKLSTSGSLSLFFEPKTLATSPGIVMASGPLEQQGFAIRVMAPGKADMRVGGKDDHSKQFAPFDAPPGQWTHLALVWSPTAEGPAISLYANGVLAGKRVFPHANLAGKDLQLGGLSHTNVQHNLKYQFDGNIYDLQFYRGALSPSEIAGLAAKPGTAR